MAFAIGNQMIRTNDEDLERVRGKVTESILDDDTLFVTMLGTSCYYTFPYPDIN